MLTSSPSCSAAPSLSQTRGSRLLWGFSCLCLLAFQGHCSFGSKSGPRSSARCCFLGPEVTSQSSFSLPFKLLCWFLYNVLGFGFFFFFVLLFERNKEKYTYSIFLEVKALSGFLLFIYLAIPNLSCSMQTLSCGM